MKTLTIIGCGKLGKTLARTLVSTGKIKIHQILNQTERSSRAAVTSLRIGKAAKDFKSLTPADIFLISVPDDAIEATAKKLSKSPALRSGSVVFHCSGALPSTLLKSVKRCGATVASIHPVKSFAKSKQTPASFAGTFCGFEGDKHALAILNPLFKRCGAKLFKVNPKTKLFYHAGTVFICSYLTALIEVGLRCYEKAGIPRGLATQMMRPIVEETLCNNLKLGPIKALTGPISRGDVKLIEKQITALAAWSTVISQAYSSLGKVAIELALRNIKVSKRNLRAIGRIIQQKAKI